MFFHRLIVAAGLCAIIAGAFAATTMGGMEATTGTWRAYRGTDFSILVCSNSSEAAMLTCIAADAERRATSTRYQLRYPNRYVTVTYSRPTCPAAPAPTTTTQNCPAGTTGSWHQTATTTIGPAPDCMATVALSPTLPPPDRCVPATTQQWTFCANEYQTCSFTGTRRARFGFGTSWVERNLAAVSGGVPCRIATFGSDPVSGVTKRCELRAVTTEPTLTATLSWTPPTQNTDGSTLTNLTGYWIHYGRSADELTQTVQIPNPGVMRYEVSGLSPGTYFFAVRAYAASGAPSDPSNVVSKIVQ
jgi:hypothetical protein